MNHLNILKIMEIKCLSLLQGRHGHLFWKELFFVTYKACLIHQRKLDLSLRKRLLSKLKKIIPKSSIDLENL